MSSRILALLLSGLLLAFVIGCGSGNTQHTTTNNVPPFSSPAPTPVPTPTPSPTTTPTPTPSPGTFGGQTAQYEAALLRPGKTGDVAAGQIWMNFGGVNALGKVQFSGGVANGTYDIIFEPFTNNASFPVGTVTSDASGNVNATFTFPQKGTFSGIFHLSAGTNSFNTEIDPMDSGVDSNTGFVYDVPAVRASAVTPSISGPVLGNDALGSGFISAGTAGNAPGTNSGKLHAELHGAAPNSTYFITECGRGGSSSCFSVNGPGVVTDASGNGTLDEPFFTNLDPAIVFEFIRDNQVQYVTGFTVQ